MLHNHTLSHTHTKLCVVCNIPYLCNYITTRTVQVCMLEENSAFMSLRPIDDVTAHG